MIFWKLLSHFGFFCILSNSGYSLKIPNLFLQNLNRIKEYQIKETLISPPNIFPITGFYGLIGPKIDHKKVESLYDLFTGDGIIQGVFLENGTATFTQTLINTEKLKFEKTFGKPLFNNNIIIGVQIMMNALRLIPNLLGVANTAFLKVHNNNENIYALFERDMPYEIHIDQNKKTVETIGKKEIPFLNTFSGHSKMVDGYIETIEYDILKNNVIWYQVDVDNKTQEFKKINEYKIPMVYMPLIHDFYSDENYIILMNSPLKMDWSNIFNKKIPIYFDESAPTFIYLIHKNCGKIETYKVDKSFYLFHYSDIEIKENEINILAPFYDRINYNEVLHNGKYRRLMINRSSGESHLFKYLDLEPLNLDFPVPIVSNNPIKHKQYILRGIENGRINGFYVLEKTDIVKKIVFEEYFICGEPGLFYLEGDNNTTNNNSNSDPVLVCFGINEVSKTQYFIMVNLETGERVEYPISHPLFIGFHSIVL